MRVLVMAAKGHLIDEITGRLRTAGHDVVRCHDADRPPFPCRGMMGTCPLDAGEPVDAALVVRHEVWPRPTQFEWGATCAIRRRVPLALAGKVVLNPFEGWIDAFVDPGEDPVAAIESMVARRRKSERESEAS